VSKYPKVGSLKKGTQFYHYNAKDERSVATVTGKRAYDVEFSLPGRNDTFCMRKDITVEVVKDRS
jgi:hypothetical protein